MRPSWIYFILGLHTGLRESQVRLLDVGKRSEDVLLNHGHDVVQVRNDEADNSLLVLQELLNLINSIEPLGFALDILRLVLVVITLLAYQ